MNFTGDPFTTRACGVPAPQGSAKGFVVKGKNGKMRAVITSDSATLRPWRSTMACAFLDAAEGKTLPLFTGPVAIVAEFILPRLKTMPKRAYKWPTGRMDLDKLCRGAGDALSVDARIIADDGLIVQWNARKRYAEEDESPGVVVTVRAVDLEWRP